MRVPLVWLLLNPSDSKRGFPVILDFWKSGREGTLLKQQGALLGDILDCINAGIKFCIGWKLSHSRFIQVRDMFVRVNAESFLALYQSYPMFGN